MTVFSHFLIILPVVTIFLSIYLTLFLIKIKRSNVPFCLSWLSRALLAYCLASMALIYDFFFIDLNSSIFEHTLIITLTEYLTTLALYLYALWQTKFTVYKSKTWQKTYILVVNVFICVVSYKFCEKIVLWPITDVDSKISSLVGLVNPQKFTQTMSVIMSSVFLITYAIFTFNNMKNPDKSLEVRRVVKQLYIALGVMLIWNVFQVLCQDVFAVYPPGHPAAGHPAQLSTVYYRKWFKINMSIKLLLNLAYMTLIYNQIVANNGRFLTDTENNI